MGTFRVVWFQTSCVPAGHRLATRGSRGKWAVQDEARDVEDIDNRNMFFILRDVKPEMALEGDDIGWDETGTAAATHLQLCIGLKGESPYLRGFLILGGDGLRRLRPELEAELLAFGRHARDGLEACLEGGDGPRRRYSSF